MRPALGVGSEAMCLDVCRDQVLLLDALKKSLGASSLSLLTPVPVCLSLGLHQLKAPHGEAHARPYSGQRKDVAMACWDEYGGRGVSCKHLNFRDTAHGGSACPSVLQWLPRKFANRRRERAESCWHRDLTFLIQVPSHCCCPQSHMSR